MFFYLSTFSHTQKNSYRFSFTIHSSPSEYRRLSTNQMKSLVLIFFICILPHHSIESQKYDHPSGSIQLTCAYPGGRPTSMRTGNVSTHLVPKYNAPNSYVLRAKPKEKRQLLIQSIHCISFQCLCGLCNQSFESMRHRLISLSVSYLMFFFCFSLSGTYIYFEHDQFIEDRVLKMDPPIDDFVAFLRETFSKPINSKEFLFICFLTNTDTTIFNKHTDPYNYQTPSTSLFGIIFLTTCIVLVFVLCFGWFIVIYYRRFRQYRLKKKLRQALAETTQQILDKSPVITFDPNNRDPDQTDSEPMCAICLEIFKSQENVRKLSKSIVMNID